MVHYQRYYYQQWRKGQLLLKDNDIIKGDDHHDDEEYPKYSLSSLVRGHANGYCYCKRARPRLHFLFLLSLLFCSLIWVLRLFGFHCSSPVSYSPIADTHVEVDSQMGPHVPLRSSITNGSVWCDRSGFRTDICFMKGDIRTNSSSSTISLYVDEAVEKVLQIEKIRPYTRKWETGVMNRIEELSIVSTTRKADVEHECDVCHGVPAVVFSTGGYTGNVYHEFNDGILPLYITSQHFNKKVVFVILEYHSWWFTKYHDIISQLSDYAPVNFNKDKRTHCFSEMIVGLRIHDELTVDSSRMEGNKSIGDFRALLDRAYWPLIKHEETEEQEKTIASASTTALASVQRLMGDEQNKPVLTILSRKRSRAITNELQVVRLAEEIGFRVLVLSPDKTMELARIYQVLNSSDAMMGVHGAAMTHLLFMRPGAVFIQVVPLGTEWAAGAYYGEPAMKLGLKYSGYIIHPKESSLYKKYHKNDPVIADPKSVTDRGWEFTKKIYLDNQTVKLDLRRFKKRLVQAYEYSILRRQRAAGRGAMDKTFR